jgi:enoyl-CoA hydratase
MSELLIQERPAGVRVVRLNRPDRLNALTPEMVTQITGAMQVGRQHRAVVITGNGRGFCAGVDIAGANERQAGRSNADAYALQERFAAMVIAIAKAPVPVISAVNGPAAGAGLAIALASDIRIGTESARFIIGAPNIGLSAGECGISYFLPRLVGLGRAAEIMLTNRHVGAAEALSIGLVTELTNPGDLETATGKLVEAIVSLSPFGQKMTKQVYRANVDAPSLEEALALENRTQILANATADAAEARLAFLEKRPPSYTGR